MPTYFIAEIEVIEENTYRAYIEQAEPIVLRFGGRYLVRGGNPVSFSGSWAPKRMVVLEFESVDALRTCFQSEEYRRIAPLREQSSRSKAIIVEGVGA